MSKILLTVHGRRVTQLCAAGAVAALMSGCSSDSTRFGDPFGNPFSTASAEQPQARQHIASARDVIPAGRMPPVTSQALAPRSSAVASLAPPRTATKAAFREPLSSETTGSIGQTPAKTAVNGSFGGWSSAGGTSIQVSDGDTADILSKRYGVPTQALLQVNGLHSANEVRPGSRITIPLYSATARAEPAARAEPEARIAEAQPRTVQPVHTLVKPTVRTAAAKLAPKALPSTHIASAAATTLVKGKKTVAMAEPKAKVAAAPIATPAPAAKSAALRPAAVQTAAVKTVAPAAAAPAKTVAAAPAKVAVAAIAAPAAPAQVAAAAPSPDNNPEFRWPAKGRIIQSFKGGSGGNDGINIAVPEGTSVKAAEGGVVAYAGSELKGYGNLVLIRHPNGFVSAYANNGEIDVKRGETVKRGQQIAKSGQSGNVSSPQLHFELRKGSTPVDPTQYLAGL